MRVFLIMLAVLYCVGVGFAQSLFLGADACAASNGQIVNTWNGSVLEDIRPAGEMTDAELVAWTEMSSGEVAVEGAPCRD